MSYVVYREAQFSAAHRLRNYHGTCENVHGHNWRVRLYVSRPALTSEGFVMDFKEIDAILAEVLKPLDHHDLNAVPPFDTINPTAEHLAHYLFEEAKRVVSQRDPSCTVVRVMVWESDKSCAIVEKST